jgi:hypothetical protein
MSVFALARLCNPVYYLRVKPGAALECSLTANICLGRIGGPETNTVAYQLNATLL